MREGELVREVEDQSIVNYEREIRELVREVEDQSAMTYERESGQSDRRYLCWICGDRPFNARHQLVDHIEGAGGGGKSHLKMRKRWMEAGQPLRDAWLEKLEEDNAVGNISFTEASSPTDAQAEQELDHKKGDGISETVEREDNQASLLLQQDYHACSGACNSPWPQTWDPQQCWQPLVPPWLDHTGPWPSLWGPVQEGTCG